MSAYKHEDLRRVFDLAIGLPTSQRGTMLDRECKGDAELRRRVEAMVAAAEDERFLASPTGGGPALSVDDLNPTLDSPSSSDGLATAMSAVREKPGAWIGPYKLRELIGEGGFGSVFMAQQEKPVQRMVALKIIKLGMDTQQVVARFEQERQALALMDHANIAKVLDAGATEQGRPFFVMELVKGRPITAFCDEGQLSIHDRLELFAQVCTAVQHAHTKGIIHRDIKPTNVLVSVQDGRAFAKVIDFGIAKATGSKLTEKTLFTQMAQIVGTPEYMSPEQAQGSLDIDTRTDVYSLGVLLYELLTGSTPFSGTELRSAAYDEIRRIIREVDPPAPSTRLSQSAASIASVAAGRRTEPKKLGTIVRGELDWIVMKAIDKDRLRRYETANGLAVDIRRYLSGEAVTAAPPGAGYRFRKFVRRNKGTVVAGSAVAAALLLGVVGFAWQASEARAQRDLALVAQRAEAEQRTAADVARDRAVQAEAETKKRAEELELVAKFQAKMLRDADTTQAGEQMVSDMRARFAQALVKAGLPEAERIARAAAFETDLKEVNATDTAVAMIDGAILKPAIKTAEEQFDDQPLVEASLMHSLAEVYKVLGRFDESAALQRRALETRRRLLGSDHPDTLLSLGNLGSILEEAGKLSEAELCYRETLEIERRVLGETHVETLTQMSNFGNFLRAQGKLDEAEPLLKAALDGRRKTLGLEARTTLISMNTYGFLLIAQGKVREAEPYWREAYETGKRVFGASDSDVLVWTNNMGGLLSSMGRHAEAEPYYRDAMERMRQVRGLEHPGTITCVLSYAGVLMALGKPADAETYYREGLNIRRRTLRDEHPDTLSCMANLGNSLREQDKFVEAEAYLRESLETKQRTLGKAHPATLSGMAHLAKLFSDQAKYAESEAIYRETLELAKGMWSPENASRLVTLNNLSFVLLSQERMAEAEPIIREVVEIRTRVSGLDHPETLAATTILARVIEDRGQLDEAEAMYRDVLDRFRRVLGERHISTISAITNLAGVLRVQGKLAESEALWREAIAILEQSPGKDHHRTGSARIGLGKTLKSMERFADAEAELIEAERVLSTAPGTPPGRHAMSMEAIVGLFRAWEKAEPGKGYDDKAEQWQAKLPPVK